MDVFLALFGLFVVALILIPPFTDWVARRLHAHALAMVAFLKVVEAGGRAYGRISERVMRETGE